MSSPVSVHNVPRAAAAAAARRRDAEVPPDRVHNLPDAECHSGEHNEEDNDDDGDDVVALHHGGGRTGPLMQGP